MADTNQGECILAEISKNPILNKVYTMKGGPDDCVDAYRDWASTYEKDTVEDMGYVAPTVVADTLAGLVTPNATILDAGCGTGLTGAALRERGIKTIDGMDISPEMLDIARAKDAYRDLRIQDMTGKLDYETDAYDATTCVGTFTHAHVGPQGFNELVRITRAGGPIVATVHEDVWPDGYEEHFAALERDGAAMIRSIEEAPYHLHKCRLCVLEAR